jgi:hypothetical protein
MDVAESGTSVGALGGQLGSSAPRERTFHGSNPGTVAEAAIMIVSGVTLYVVFRRGDWL